MKTILFLFLIYSINAYANDTDNQGCTISFFKKEAPCSTPKKKKITIEPIIIENSAKKQSITSKDMELKLRTILSDVTQYKNENNIKTNKLMEELNTMKKELKKVKKELDINKKKVNYTKKKLLKKLVKVKKELYHSNKKIDQTKRALIKTQNKLSKKNIIVKNVKKETPTIHKTIRKMSPSPIVMYDSPWIEIIVENDIDIYELALKYYGDTQAYKKIYVANKNVISDDLKIHNGMSLIIPITETFEEQPLMLNTY